jgi:hypothetical protein
VRVAAGERGAAPKEHQYVAIVEMPAGKGGSLLHLVSWGLAGCGGCEGSSAMTSLERFVCAPHSALVQSIPAVATWSEITIWVPGRHWGMSARMLALLNGCSWLAESTISQARARGAAPRRRQRSNHVADEVGNGKAMGRTSAAETAARNAGPVLNGGAVAAGGWTNLQGMRSSCTPAGMAATAALWNCSWNPSHQRSGWDVGLHMGDATGSWLRVGNCLGIRVFAGHRHMRSIGEPVSVNHTAQAPFLWNALALVQHLLQQTFVPLGLGTLDVEHV